MITYFRLPDQPGAEVIMVDGEVRQALETTDRPVEYYGEVFLVERSLRIDAPGTLMMLVDGEAVYCRRTRTGRARGSDGIAGRPWLRPCPLPPTSDPARPDPPPPRRWRRRRS